MAVKNEGEQDHTTHSDSRFKATSKNPPSGVLAPIHLQRRLFSISVVPILQKPSFLVDDSADSDSSKRLKNFDGYAGREGGRRNGRDERTDGENKDTFGRRE